MFILVQSVNAGIEGLSGDCVWHLDGASEFNRPCSDYVQLDVPEVGALVEVSQGNVVVASQRISPKRIIVLGIGDSYSSGEGNPDKPTVWKSKELRKEITVG